MTKMIALLLASAKQFRLWLSTKSAQTTASNTPGEIPNHHAVSSDEQSTASTNTADSSQSETNPSVPEPLPPETENSEQTPSVLPKTKPREIDGQRDKPRQISEPKQRRYTVRPELICRKIPHNISKWEVVLSANKECQLTTAHLENVTLQIKNQKCCIPELSGQLVVSFENDKKDKITLWDGNPLIFKLQNKWKGDGRKISRITYGYFIVIVPKNWERTGHVEIEPDNCADTEFLAHYFRRDDSTSEDDIGSFRDYENSLVAVSSIELLGEHVFDNSEEGKLFIDGAPTFNASQDIVWGRVGEEAELGWKGENFEPHKQALSDILNGRQGRFFLRIYDSKPKLLDSTEFRYLPELKQICVNDEQYTQDMFLIPQPTGYPPTEIRFVGTDGNTIFPILSEDTHATVQLGVIKVPPHPDADSILCTLESDTGNVKILLNLPRIWWQVVHDPNDTGKWCDTPIIMTRQEFQACKNATMLLLSKRLKSIQVGFNNDLDRWYPRTMQEKYIRIPLTHFIQYEQISRRLNDDAKFNIKWGERTLTLILVSADPMPEIVSFTAEPITISDRQEVILQWVTRNADQAHVIIEPNIGRFGPNGTYSVFPTKTMKYKLTLVTPDTNEVTKTVIITVDFPPVTSEQPTVLVYRGGGWKNGKGFSYGEIQDAGLTLQEAAGRFFPTDRRRRSSHLANIETIRKMIDARYNV